ncbi:flagellar basal body-associated FliL family protein [Desulfatitalea tepidiphila]|uniref:flagellar basal body-associated FliL family protein n=1 Tax=Desulfatitalea tepidiphila TaxID=1185843 RepID=UPI0006B42E5F|nr:flagellar basal body-associated FliL family protein [Desulfatitalea tepidiphila]
MSTKTLVIVLAAVVLVIAVMGGGFFLMWTKMNTTLAQMQMQNAAENEAEETPKEEEVTIGPIYKMETLIVNLADQGGKRYLRITMELELSAPEVMEEINNRMPQLRDAILMVLPSKQYSDIGSTEGKIALRDELIAKINGILKKGTVTTIYFTEFVVQ